MRSFAYFRHPENRKPGTCEENKLDILREIEGLKFRAA